jgi:hypothetical protein
LHRAGVGGPLLVDFAVMFEGEVVVVEVLVIPEAHADALVVPAFDDLLLVDVCEVHEVTIVVDGLMGNSRWKPGRPAASVRPDAWCLRMSRRTCAGGLECLPSRQSWRAGRCAWKAPEWWWNYTWWCVECAHALVF